MGVLGINIEKETKFFMKNSILVCAPQCSCLPKIPSTFNKMSDAFSCVSIEQQNIIVNVPSLSMQTKEIL